MAVAPPRALPSCGELSELWPSRVSARKGATQSPAAPAGPTGPSRAGHHRAGPPSLASASPHGQRSPHHPLPALRPGLEPATQGGDPLP